MVERCVAHMIKVCKFGGTAMAQAESIKRVADIVVADDTRIGIVLSAPGKRHEYDTKVTDLLYRAFAEPRVWNDIRERFVDIIVGLDIDFDIDKEFNQIFLDINNGINSHYIVSRGEYLIGKIFAKYIGFEFVDAKEIIMLDHNGNIDLVATRRQSKVLLNQYMHYLSSNISSSNLSKHKGFVLPGFYGACNNQICLLGRGGSDISGAILSNILTAKVYENWTDVDGFFAFDPRFGNSNLNATISYRQAIDLSQFGATVLHPDSCVVASIDETPIIIKNTFAPTNCGTKVVKHNYCKKSKLVGVGGIKFNKILQVTKPDNIGHPLSRDLLWALHKSDIEVNNLVVNDNNAYLHLTNNTSTKDINIFKKALKNINSNYVVASRKLSLIKLVGRDIVDKALSILRLRDIKVVYSMVAQDSTLLGVYTKDFDKSIKVLYSSFA